MTAKATDLGKPPQFSTINFDIRVVESHKKAPAFLPRPMKPIKLKENFSDFDASIISLKAVSNVNNSNKADNSNLLFELLTGSTQQTNKDNNFRYLSINRARVLLFAKREISTTVCTWIYRMWDLFVNNVNNS